VVRVAGSATTAASYSCRGMITGRSWPRAISSRVRSVRDGPDRSGQSIHLDLTHLEAGLLRQRFPKINQTCLALDSTDPRPTVRSARRPTI
jgi:hypothetical protein